jgi:hypothetical protein
LGGWGAHGKSSIAGLQFNKPENPANRLKTLRRSSGIAQRQKLDCTHGDPFTG